MKIKKILTKLIKSASVFDYVLLGILAVMGIVLFFFFYRKSEYIDITVKVTDQDIFYERSRPGFVYAEHFVVGDVEKNSLGTVISEITNVERFPVKDGDDLVFVDLRVKATYDSRTQLYSARGQNINYASPTRFFMTGVTFDGYIVDFPGRETQSSFSEQKVRFTVRQKNIEEDLAQKVSIGDLVTDSEGNELLKVVDIDIKPVRVGTFNSAGRLIIDTSLKDVDITFESEVAKLGDTLLLFHDIPLIIGEAVSMRVENYSIGHGIIVDIQELD